MFPQSYNKISKRTKITDGFCQNPGETKNLQVVESGEADGIKPKALLESCECCQKFGLSKFRDALNRLSRERRSKLLPNSRGNVDLSVGKPRRKSTE